LQLATAQDIDRLVLTVRRLGEDFGEQFEQLNKRLDDLTTRLDALAGQAATRSNSSPAESSPVPSVASVRKPKRRHKNARHE